MKASVWISVKDRLPAFDYAVRKGYEYDADIPVEELERLFREDEIVRTQQTLFDNE